VTTKNRPPAVHVFATSGEAYNASQTSDAIHDGDVLVASDDRVVAVLVEAWPVAIDVERGKASQVFHSLIPSMAWDAIPSMDEATTKDYSESASVARREQAKLDARDSREIREVLAAVIYASELHNLSRADVLAIVASCFGESLASSSDESEIERIAKELGIDLDPFRPTHRYRATYGDPSVLVQLVGPGLSESEALVRFADRAGDDPSRVARRSLIALDACSCEYRDDGDGESGPHLHVDADPECPRHGVEADPESWRDVDSLPDASRVFACAICGEPVVVGSPGAAEMYDAAKLDDPELYSEAESGIVHAECGLARGWQVA